MDWCVLRWHNSGNRYRPTVHERAREDVPSASFRIKRTVYREGPVESGRAFVLGVNQKFSREKIANCLGPVWSGSDGTGDSGRAVLCADGNNTPALMMNRGLISPKGNVTKNRTNLGTGAVGRWCIECMQICWMYDEDIGRRRGTAKRAGESSRCRPLPTSRTPSLIPPRTGDLGSPIFTGQAGRKCAGFRSANWNEV